MTTVATTRLRVATSGTLLAASGLHAAWGRGSTFPFTSPAGLTDHVVGAARTPSRGACYSVAAGLAGAAGLVMAPSRGRLHRRMLGTLATLFAARACFGFAGRTDLLVPGSSSPTFRRNDRRYFAPICSGLAFGFAVTARRPR